MIGSLRRVVGILLANCAVIGFATAAAPLAAQASVLNTSLCDGASLSQPFLSWADSNLYKLAPGGDFEGTLSGWTLSGGAGQTGGSESYGVTGAVGASSLSLPDGAAAVSPRSCVNADYPDFRFFTRSDTPGAMVSAAIVYSVGHATVTISVGTAVASSSWQPTAPMSTGGALIGLLSGGTGNLALQFSAHGGEAQIDDVFIDPSGRCC